LFRFCYFLLQPEGELSDLIRLFFQIELAHWFFLDFYCTQDENSVYSCGIKQFAQNIFEHIPFLNHHVPNLNTILEEWRSYKTSVPTYGTIMLSPDMRQCLLVQSFFAKNSWSFPKGKVNENEDPLKCAIREVYEETGFDCGHLVNSNDFIEGQTSNYQYTRLYIVKNVPIDTKFCPRTRNEIKDCSWFSVDLLPTNRNDEGYMRLDRKIRANSFYMILPFISKLKHWIMNERMGMNTVGRGKKKQQQPQLQHNGQQQRKKNNVNGNSNGAYVKQPNSPFFYNNGGDHNNPRNNGKQRHKSTGDPPIQVTEVFNGSPANGTFYNDHMKLQNNSSTPIANNSPFMPSSTSAFRATNSDTKFKKNGKVKSNVKVNQSMPGQQNGNQDQFKRKLFSEANGNGNGIKPFTMPDGMPESWKNFQFDPKKLFGSM
jgi:mRNA-decapping enzyme subunit 2